MSDLEGHIERAIKMGLADFWRAYPWYFATREDTITTVAGTDTYSLDTDFESAIVLTEKTSMSGNRLTFVSREEFEYLVPATGAHTSSTPSIYTIYWDDDAQVDKLKLFRVPQAAITLYLWQRNKPPYDAVSVPDTFISGLTAFIWKYIWPTGPNKQQAIVDARIELDSCISRDKKNTARKNFVLLDAGADPRQRGYLWEKDVSWAR